MNKKPKNHGRQIGGIKTQNKLQNRELKQLRYWLTVVSVALASFFATIFLGQL